MPKLSYPVQIPEGSIAVVFCVDGSVYAELLNIEAKLAVKHPAVFAREIQQVAGTCLVALEEVCKDNDLCKVCGAGKESPCTNFDGTVTEHTTNT